MLTVRSNQMETMFLDRVTDTVTSTLREAFAEMPDAPKIVRDEIAALVNRVYPAVRAYDVPTERFVAKFCLLAAFLGDGFDRQEPQLKAALKRPDVSRYAKEDMLERYLAAALSVGAGANARRA